MAFSSFDGNSLCVVAVLRLLPRTTCEHSEMVACSQAGGVLHPVRCREMAVWGVTLHPAPSHHGHIHYGDGRGTSVACEDGICCLKSFVMCLIQHLFFPPGNTEAGLQMKKQCPSA